MSLANALAKADEPPERLDVRATCVMDEVEGRGHLVVSSHLDVRASPPGLTDDVLRGAVEAADAGCPISTLIRGTAEVSVDARLDA